MPGQQIGANTHTHTQSLLCLSTKLSAAGTNRAIFWAAWPVTSQLGRHSDLVNNGKKSQLCARTLNKGSPSRVRTQHLALRFPPPHPVQSGHMDTATSSDAGRRFYSQDRASSAPRPVRHVRPISDKRPLAFLRSGARRTGPQNPWDKLIPGLQPASPLKSPHTASNKGRSLPGLAELASSPLLRVPLATWSRLVKDALDTMGQLLPPTTAQDRRSIQGQPVGLSQLRGSFPKGFPIRLRPDSLKTPAQVTRLLSRAYWSITGAPRQQ